MDLDDEALDAAKEVLGTKSKVDTVNAALRQVTREARLRDFWDTLRDSDLGDPEVTQGAWRT